MNSTIIFTDLATFDAAVASLEMNATPEYVLERDALTIRTDDVDGIVDLLIDDGIDGFSANYGTEDEHDQFLTDAEADADALASAGFGTDEDYGYYGGDDE
jgi:hypothetical protein